MLSQHANEPRWPIGMALLTAWLWPATTARRMAHALLAGVWLLHLFASVLTVVAIMFLVAWSKTDASGDINRIISEFTSLIVSSASYVGHQPSVLAASALGIEAAFLGLAFLVMPWGACDEALRNSYRNSLRQTWLQTAHFIPVVLIVGTIGIVSARWASDYAGALAGLIVIAMPLWLLWGLLRGVGAARTVPAVARPPTCEECGYNLTSIPMDSRCPECGEAVAASLGPDARSGTVWQRRREIGRFTAWWQCCVAVMRRPHEFGRQLCTVSPGTDHRWFFALHFPLIFFAGSAGIITAALLSAGVSEVTSDPVIPLLIMSMFGCACVAGAVMFTLLVVVVIGVLESVRYKRNLLPGTMQVACYLGGYLALWALFGAATGGLVVTVHEKTSWFNSLEDFTGIYRDLLAQLTWLLPNLACCIGYCLLVRRGTAGTQYANR